MPPLDIVITGLPRGGTTLTCELLSSVPDTVALDEPMDNAAWSGRTLIRRTPKKGGQSVPLDARRFIREVRSFFDNTRRALLAGESVHTKHVGGKVFGGKFLDERTETGLRKQITSRSAITLDKELTPDFALAVKHNAGFTVALEHLVKHFPTYAIVRHPLSTLSSWQTVDIPINRGRVGRAERSDPSLRALLDDTPDVLDRQLILLDWFFGAYDRHLPRESVISYEDIVATGGAALGAIVPAAADLTRGMESRNKASVYDRDMMRTLGERLLATDGAWWKFYAKDSVRELME
jgi:hypothetical protein